MSNCVKIMHFHRKVKVRKSLQMVSDQVGILLLYLTNCYTLNTIYKFELYIYIFVDNVSNKIIKFAVFCPKFPAPPSPLRGRDYVWYKNLFKLYLRNIRRL